MAGRDADELADLTLVRLAFAEDTRGCVEWDYRSAEVVGEKHLFKHGLDVVGVRTATIQYVRKGGKIVRVSENRKEWQYRREHW